LDHISGINRHATVLFPDELNTDISSWDELPASIRTAIVVLLTAAKQTETKRAEP
jgi:hypothetical protein